MKYGNTKIMIDGIRFDSKKEASRYRELKLMQRAGVIQNLEVHPTWELVPTQRAHRETLRKATYSADFRYIKDGHEVVEDVKGFKTEEYKLKRKLMLYLHGVYVYEL